MRRSREKKVSRWRPLKIMLGVVLAVFVFSIGTTVFGKKADTSLESVSLGENYITEIAYKQAIADYKADLKVDPKNKAAKEGLLGTYMDWAGAAVDEGNISLATDILRAGFSDTHSTDLVWKILEISFSGMGFSDMYGQAMEGFKMFGGME